MYCNVFNTHNYKKWFKKQYMMLVSNLQMTTDTDWEFPEEQA